MSFPSNILYRRSAHAVLIWLFPWWIFRSRTLQPRLCLSRADTEGYIVHRVKDTSGSIKIFLQVFHLQQFFVLIFHINAPLLPWLPAKCSVPCALRPQTHLRHLLHTGSGCIFTAVCKLTALSQIGRIRHQSVRWPGDALPALPGSGWMPSVPWCMGGGYPCKPRGVYRIPRFPRHT